MCVCYHSEEQAMDESQGAEIQRGLGRVEAALAGLKDGQTSHQQSDDREFREIRTNFATQSERLTAMEGLSNMVEGHGAALSELEQNVSETREREKIRLATSARDNIWIRWVFFIVAAIAADLYAPKLLGLVSSILK